MAKTENGLEKYKTPLLIVSAIALFFFFIISVYLVYEKITLDAALDKTMRELGVTKLQLDEAKQNIRQLNLQLDSTRSELNATYETLYETQLELNETRQQFQATESKLNVTEEELHRTANLLNETKSEFLKLRSDIQAIEDNIDSSIQWFKDNSQLASSLDSYTYRVENYCIKQEKLNLGCAVYLMQNRLKFSYKSESPDKLFSIDEMVSRQGGDCEDFSLFMKALLTTFKRFGYDATIQAWEPGSGNYVIFEETNGTKTTQWYVNGKAKDLGRLSQLTPYVICFAVDQNSGHCIVAVSQKNVTSVNELHNLDGAQAFEPQTGMYMAEVGKQLLVCDNGQLGCDRAAQHISFVIAEDDLYQFTEGSWKSYALYGNAMEKLGEEISIVTG